MIRIICTMALMLCICLSSVALGPQTRNSSRQKTQKTQNTQKPTNTKKNQKTQNTQKAQNTKKTQKSQKSQKTQTPSPTGKKEQLQAQQKKLKKDIEANKKQKAELEKKVKKQLEEVFVMGTQIDEQKKVIDTIRVSIDSIDGQIAMMNTQLETLQKELKERQARYANSVRYMHRNRKMQSKMMFVLSAKNINQMYRRTRFMNEYATYQKAQGEAVKQKQEQVEQKKEELKKVKAERNTMLAKEEKEKQTLQHQQEQKQHMANELQKQQKTVTALISKQQKEEEELNAKIDKLIAEEIAREKARIEAERKRKADELARRLREEKARQQRLAEARAREEKAKQDAKNAKTNQEKAAAKQRAKDAEKERKTAEKELADNRKQEKKNETRTYTNDTDQDAKLTGSFASNKGRLPMPITGAYQMIRRFGENIVDNARGVHLTCKGIYLKGQPGAQARCVFDGEVSKIFATGNSYIVMVRHGKFISVYSDLASVAVAAGQKVKTNQSLGKLGPTNVMQFQLRNWTELLNPQTWLRR